MLSTGLCHVPDTDTNVISAADALPVGTIDASDARSDTPRMMNNFFMR